MFKILFVTKTLIKGGAASGARNLLNALQSLDNEIIVMDAYKEQYFRPIGLLRKLERICERVIPNAAETHFLCLGSPVFDLVKLYNEYHPDIIQLCDVSGNIIRFSDIAKVPCPVVHRMSDFWPYHGARHYAEAKPQRTDLVEWLLQIAVFNGYPLPDARVAPSAWLANSIEGGKIRVIRNAVTSSENTKARCRVHTPIRLGFIADRIMNPRKGFSVLPPLLSGLANRIGHFSLHVFGRTNSLKVPSIPGVQVKIHGPFGKDELKRVYGSFDILLCPSRKDNSPNTLTEALAYGVPVIAQSSTGMETYIEPSFGKLVDFYGEIGSTINCLEDAVESLIENFEEASRFAIEYVNQELLPEVIGQKYLNLYQELLSNKI